MMILKKLSRKILFTVFLLLAAGIYLPAPGQAAQTDGRVPLLQQGKKTLYQRVVTHPGAMLYASAADTKAVDGAGIKPFSVFYVYGREAGRLEVGPSSHGPVGWIESSVATEWPQAMTLLFTAKDGRMPVLFFTQEEKLKEICQADDMVQQLDKLAAVVKAPGATIPADFPLIAAEPSDEQGAVSSKRFYLMPIQEMRAPFEGTKFLRVASIDPGSGKGGSGKGTGQDGSGKDGKPGTMSTGIVFVIDTTISMRPYIEQSLNVIRASFDDLEKEKLGDNVGFAVVAFRNNTEGRDKLEYVTQVVSDFKTLANRKELEDSLSKVKEAEVSTHSFNEDSMAGIQTAVDKLSWDQFQSKLIVLITDAGPLQPGDQLASTRMAPTEMLDYAKAKGIWVTVCHVRTPAGAKDQAYAEKSYRALSSTGSGSSYIPIPAPTPQKGAESFAKAAKTLAQSLTKVVKNTSEHLALSKPQQQEEAETPEERAKQVADRLGYAMQLEFIGSRNETRAPSVVSAWISDMDLARLANGQYSPSVEVAVLLTKNQLSDLQKQLQIIIDQAERTKKTDSRDFFAGIISASAQLARDPAAFSAKPGQNLQETGVLAEFLDGLPYKSDIMLLREDDWYRMSVGEQTSFINRLRSKIARYEEYDKDRDNWESFGAPDSGDWVYRVPLSMLP